MCDQLKVVAASVDDLDDLVTLENRVFTSDQISRRQFRYLLTKAHGALFKAVLNNVFVGYVSVLQRKKSSILRIYSLAVVPELRQQGVARSLLDQVEMLAVRDKYSSMSLEVCEKNIKALKIYLARGFTVTAEKTQYYEDGCTALKLKKNMIFEGKKQ